MLATATLIANRYRVVNYLGGGGMKHVYLVQDLNLASRPCALAEIVDNFPTPNARAQAAAAFRREAQLLATLSNEHIPHIYDTFSENNVHFLVMEYIEGVTLEQMITDSDGKLSESSVVDIAVQILEALEYLHGLRPPVIYRDLKPSNVIITPGGRVKLVDFGIARHFQPLKTATMVGTQGYAPPEQYKGKVEPRSDLYALGATIHHALSGRNPAIEPPFSFPPLDQVCPGCNPTLASLVNDALTYKPENRVPSASEFRNRLVLLQGVAQQQTARLDHSLKRSRWRTLGIATLSLLILAFVAFVAMLVISSNSGPEPALKISTPEAPSISTPEAPRKLDPIEELEQEVSKNPKDLKAWLRLGHAKARAAEHETNAGVKDAENTSALDAYEHALNLSLNDLGALKGVAVQNFRLAQYNEAIEASKRYLQSSSNDARVLTLLGASYLRNSEPTKAVKPLKRAVAIDSESSLAYYNLGYAYYTLDKPVDARSELKKALKFASDDEVRDAAQTLLGKVEQKIAAERPIAESENAERRPSATIGSNETSSKPKPEPRSYFTIGSTKDEVLAVQGNPTAVNNYTFFEVWEYGSYSCDVTFDSNGRVKSYTNDCGELRVRVR
jgi:serine/threonine protein kinase